ncbi:MAG: hypothetical protein Q9184_005688 [Pyrenodesmia sp. 2 TL-2023]
MAYDPKYYQQQAYVPSNQQQYVPAGYTPHGDRQLTQSRYSPQPAYPTTQSLTPYQPPSPGYDYDRRPSSHDERYMYPDEDRPRRHRHRSRSRHSHRSKSRSRSRDLGSSLLGAAGGGFLGHKYGGGTLGALGGAVAGAIGANLAGKEWEKHKEREHRRELSGEERGRGIVDNLLHPEQAIRRAKSKVRGELDDSADGGRRKHRHRHDRGTRSLSRGYYEEEYEMRRKGRD